MADAGTVNITLLQFGNRKEMEVEEGATLGDVVDRIEGAEGLEIRSRGQDVRDENVRSQPVEPGQTVTASPRSLKNGS